MKWVVLCLIFLGVPQSHAKTANTADMVACAAKSIPGICLSGKISKAGKTNVVTVVSNGARLKFVGPENFRKGQDVMVQLILLPSGLYKAQIDDKSIKVLCVTPGKNNEYKDRDTNLALLAIH